MRDAERVLDVGLAGAADLVGVGLAGDVEGPLDERGVGPPVAGLVLGEERDELGVDLVAPPGARQDRSGGRVGPRGYSCPSPS